MKQSRIKLNKIRAYVSKRRKAVRLSGGRVLYRTGNITRGHSFIPEGGGSFIHSPTFLIRH